LNCCRPSVERSDFAGWKVSDLTKESVLFSVSWDISSTISTQTCIILAVAAAVFSLTVQFPLSQPLLILAGALIGLGICWPGGLASHPLSVRVSNGLAAGMLMGFAALFLLSLPRVCAALGPAATVFGVIYRSGALVFGGGHVVLPLLQDAVVAPGWVSPDAFLSGYGAAQALPGPLFFHCGVFGSHAVPLAERPGGRASCVARYIFARPVVGSWRAAFLG
jgi:chromate transporter